MRFKGFSKFGGGMKAKAWGWKKKACFQERTDDDRHEHGDHDDKHGLGHFSLKKALKALDIDSDNDWKGGWTHGRIKKKKTDHDEDDLGARKWSHPIWKKRDKDDDDHTYKVKKVWPGCKTPEPEQPDQDRHEPHDRSAPMPGAVQRRSSRTADMAFMTCSSFSAFSAQGSRTTPLPMMQTVVGERMPLGMRWRMVVSPATFTVWPALFPP